MKNKKLIIIISTFVIISLIIFLTIFLTNTTNSTHSDHIKSYFDNKILTSLAETQSMDTTKPTLIVFFASYCKTCHDFMPAFKQLSKDYAKTYNFAALNIEDPSNYPLVAGNVGGIPSLYIFDTEIGNKVHISLSSIRTYNQLREELDRYLRIRSYIDIKKAKAEHEKVMQAYLEEIQKNVKKEGKN